MDDTVHNRDIHSYFTRSAQNVHTTFRRTVKVAKSFLNNGSQYYYNLPVNIRGVCTYGTSKKLLKLSLKPGLNIIAIFISFFLYRCNIDFILKKCKPIYE